MHEGGEAVLMRRRFVRGLLLFAAVVVALSAAAPAMLFASHQPLFCGREHCFSCRVQAEGIDFLRRLFVAPPAAALLGSLLAAACAGLFRLGVRISALSPVKSGVRLNN
jgi:hypothetical protein